MEEVVSSPPLDKLTERKRPLTGCCDVSTCDRHSSRVVNMCGGDEPLTE